MDQPPDLKALEKAKERRKRSRERAERKRKVPGSLTGITHLFIFPSQSVFNWLLHPTSSHPTTSHPSTSSSSECHFTFTEWRRLHPGPLSSTAEEFWSSWSKTTHVLICTISTSTCIIIYTVECKGTHLWKHSCLDGMKSEDSKALNCVLWSSAHCHPPSHQKHKSQ